MVGISENHIYTLSKHPSPATSSSYHPHQTYDDALHVSPTAWVFCEILKNAKLEDIEALLSSSGVIPTKEIVEEVLNLSYSCPEKALIFFKWVESGPGWARSGPRCDLLGSRWDILVDLLGSNGLFEKMWDVVRSMRENGILSINTFLLVFRNYCGAGRVEEAVMTFDLMEGYGVGADVAAMNALLREICPVSDDMEKLFEFFNRVKEKISPDIDTYAVIMEGLEKEGNVTKAKSLLDEMVDWFGWEKENVRIYDAFLVTLFRGSQIDEAIKFVEVLKGKGCFPGLRFFSDAIRILHKKKDLARVSSLWDIMADNGILPNVGMHNSVITLYCNDNKIACAFRLLDEMILYGAFPDSVTYNTIFRCLVKNKKVQEACTFFTEMTKNECPPTHLNCAAAIALFFDGDNPEMAVEIWYYMVNNRIFPFEESANMLLIGLCNLGRLTELKRHAEKMLDRNIHISEATMAKIKQAFHKRGGDTFDSYDSLSRKWKLSL